jgi:3-deoxy-D-manno-octulosonic-acid transferase
VGSLKFDAARLDDHRTLDVAAILRQLGVPQIARVLVAGSTHPGEEAMIAEQFLRLKSRFQDLFLVLVPRHFERTKDVTRELRERGVKFALRGEIKAATKFNPGELDCLVVNTTGELMDFYQGATIVFVGKSMRAQGGQNIIEPCALGKATVFGPNMQNFEDVVRIMLKGEGAVQVRDEAELEKVLGELLLDRARRERLGANALKVVRENLGAVERTVDMIVQRLDGTELYIAPP